MIATEADFMKQSSINSLKKRETTAQLAKRLVIAYYAKKGISVEELSQPGVVHTLNTSTQQKFQQ
jgi:hypothetical protein